MSIIHEEGLNLERGKKLLVNSDLEHPIYSLCASIKYLMCSPAMQSLFPIFIRAGMCLDPFVL